MGRLAGQQDLDRGNDAGWKLEVGDFGWHGMAWQPRGQRQKGEEIYIEVW